MRILFPLFCVSAVSSTHIQFDNVTAQMLISEELGVRDNHVYTMMVNAFRDREDLKACRGKRFNVQTGDSFYQVESYILLGTYDAHSPSHKKCTGNVMRFRGF